MTTGARTLREQGAPARDDSAAGLVDAVRADPALRHRARRRLGLTEKVRLAVEILATYVRVRRGVHVVALPDLLAALRRGVVDRETPARSLPGEHVTAVRLGRAVMGTMSWLPGDTRCLTRSLVLTTILARRDIGSTLLIAVAPEGEFRAHAWVEHGGVPVLPADEPGFGRLVAL